MNAVGRYAKPKASPVKSLKEYRKISFVSEDNAWMKLENDNGLYKATVLVVLSQELESKLLSHKEEIAEMMKKRVDR